MSQKRRCIVPEMMNFPEKMHCPRKDGLSQKRRWIVRGWLGDEKNHCPRKDGLSQKRWIVPQKMKRIIVPDELSHKR
jgi:hypothetical protein